MSTVLVVDDEPDIRDLVALNLRLDGHLVRTAADGLAALEAVRAEPPDVIVLDVMMPGLDGFGVLAELKGDAGAPARIPVVLLTARTDRMDRIRGGIEGAVVYLTKPFSVTALRESVRSVLGAGAESELRRRATSDALADLARVEAGSTEAATAARPRLTRFEPQGPRPTGKVTSGRPFETSRLSARQAELLDAVVAAPNLAAAARQLGVSRSYLYATLGRIAELVGVSNGPEVVRVARQAAAASERR